MSDTPSDIADRIRGTRAIALDGGTTNTRARLIEGGRIVATARREIGIRDAAVNVPPPPLEGGVAAKSGAAESSSGSPGSRLAEAVRGVIEEAARIGGGERPEWIVAAGMLSSELGLVTVPHVMAPAGLAELAAAVAVRTIPAVGPFPIHFVPGVRTPAPQVPGGWTRGDVMRGEECETLGALGELERSGALDSGADRLVFVWPGSHTKLVEVDRDGRIARSHTSLAGELLQAVSRYTLIKASLPAELPDVLSPSSIEAGERAVEESGLARAAFLVRMAALEQAMGAEDRAGFWIGAVVADDARALARHPILDGDVWIGVGGKEPLRSLYVRALSRYTSRRISRLDDALCERCSALGALSIALAGAAERPQVSPR